MNKWTAILKRKAAMAERGFSGARGLMYDHYTKYADDVERDTQSPVRKAFWFGRYGVPAEIANVDQLHFPIWAAGYDLYLANGMPDYDVDVAVILTVRDIADRLFNVRFSK